MNKPPTQYTTSIYIRLKDLKNNKNKNYSNLAEYFLKQDNKKNLKIVSVAEDNYISVATVERFVKLVGFQSFVEFKLMLYNEKIEIKEKSKEHIPNTYINYFDKSIQALNDIKNSFDFNKIENFVKEMEGKNIKCFGLGSSYLVAQDFEQKFERLGYFCKSYNDINLLKMNLSNSSKDTIFLAFSYSGYTKETLYLLQKAENLNLKTALITSNEKLVSDYDYVFLLPKIENYQRRGSIFSRILMLNVVDFIYLEYYKNNKKKSDALLDKTNYS